ncbi:hypothetical protein J3A83DRAFT_4185874 [Scleroderma citrinum]
MPCHAISLLLLLLGIRVDIDGRSKTNTNRAEITYDTTPGRDAPLYSLHLLIQSYVVVIHGRPNGQTRGWIPVPMPKIENRAAQKIYTPVFYFSLCPDCSLLPAFLCFSRP